MISKLDCVHWRRGKPSSCNLNHKVCCASRAKYPCLDFKLKTKSDYIETQRSNYSHPKANLGRK